MAEKNIDKLIEKFENSTKAIRQRLLLLGTFCVIIFGLLLIRNKETERWNLAVESDSVLRWMIETPDTLVAKKLSNLSADDHILPGLWGIGSYVENWDILLDSFTVSNFANKALVKQALHELRKTMPDIQREQTISFFGVELTVDPWYYTGLLVILIILHDLTRTILYQKELGLRLKQLNINKWELGSDQLEYFGETKSPTDKFITVVSSLLLGLILLCPIAAGIMSMKLNMFFTTSEVAKSINNFLLFLIITHSAIIFYSENIFGARIVTDFLTSKGKKPRLNFYLIWGIWYLITALICVSWAMEFVEIPTGLMFFFLFFILVFLFCFPFGIWLNNHNPKGKSGKGLIFVSLLLNASWFRVYYRFEHHYPLDYFTDYTIEFLWYLLAVSILTVIYIWLFLPKKGHSV